MPLAGCALQRPVSALSGRKKFIELTNRWSDSGGLSPSRGHGGYPDEPNTAYHVGYALGECVSPQFVRMVRLLTQRGSVPAFVRQRFNTEPRP